MHTLIGTSRCKVILARLGASVLALGLAILCTSCSCGFHMANSRSSAPYVRLVADPEANQTSAVAVDVVLVYQNELVETLRDLTARAWFEQRSQLRRDHPNPKKSYEAFSLELVPGQQARQSLPRLSCARAGFVFADYAQSGVHRERFASNLDSLIVDLDRDGFSLQPDATTSSESP